MSILWLIHNHSGPQSLIWHFIVNANANACSAPFVKILSKTSIIALCLSLLGRPFHLAAFTSLACFSPVHFLLFPRERMAFIHKRKMCI
jgi:hypothetical protein